MQDFKNWSTSAARGKLVNLTPRSERCSFCGKPFDKNEYVRREGRHIRHMECAKEHERLRDLGMLE